MCKHESKLFEQQIHGAKVTKNPTAAEVIFISMSRIGVANDFICR